MFIYYVSIAVEPFKLTYISETVLRRLIAQKIYYYVKNIKDNDARSIKQRTIYTAGRPADYFVMILEGKTKVTVGSENLVFDAGPFTYFGTSALRLTASDIRNQSTISRPPTPDSPNFGSTDIRMAIEANKLPSQPGTAETNVMFRPDFSVVIVEPTLYMKVPRNVYIAAYRASLLEHQKGCPADEEKLQKEIDNAFNDNLLNKSPDLARKDYHIAGEREKLLYENQVKNGQSNGNSPRSERRGSQANPTSPSKRKNSLAALARLPIQAAAKLTNNNSNSKAPNSPLSNFPPTLNLTSAKVNPTADRKSTPPSQGPRASSPTRANTNNRRNGSPKKDSPRRGSSPSPPRSPKEDSHLISGSKTKPK